MDREYLTTLIPANFEHPQYDYGLFLISRSLTVLNKSLTDVRMPNYIHNWDLSDGNPLVASELYYDLDEELTAFETAVHLLNSSQPISFNTVTEMIMQNPTVAYFFVQGQHRIGKTFIYKCLCYHFRSKNDIVNVLHLLALLHCCFQEYELRIYVLRFH